MKMNSNSQLFSLRWNNYLGHITGAFETLRSGEDFVDVTLSCEGKKIKAHKMLLSACSSYFKEIFKDNPCQHPVIVFRNVRYTDLVALINFIYQGEVNVVQEQLSSFLATAELLAIKGLTDCNDSDKIKEDEWEYEQEEITPTVHINSTDSPISLTPINKGGADSKSLISKKRPNEQNVYDYHDSEQNFVRSKKSSKPPPLSALSDNGKQSVEIIPVLSGGSVVSDQKNNNIPYSSVESSISQRDNSKFISSEEPMLSELDIDDDMTPNVEVEIRHLPTKQAVSEVEANQESIQGHWLSSLNNNNTNHNNNNSNCNNNNNNSSNNNNISNNSNNNNNNNNNNSSSNNNNNNNQNNNNENTNNEAENQKHRHICNICGATYKHLRNLRAHCHLHYGKTKCNLCDKVLCNISYFKKHLQQQHGLLTDYTNKKKFEINK